MSCFRSHADSASSEAAKTGAPHPRPAPTSPTPTAARIAAKTAWRSGRAAGIARVRGALQRSSGSGRRATMGPPGTALRPRPTVALPTTQASAPSVSVNVNNARWRRKMSSVASSSTIDPATKSHGARSAMPTTAVTPPTPQTSGPRYATVRPIATARSSEITTPKKAQIISGPCSAALPAAIAGTCQPRRARPASTPATRPMNPRTRSGTR